MTARIPRDDYLRDHWLYHKKGSQLPQAKLTESDVTAIRAVGLAKTAKQLAAEYGVSAVTIEKIRSYERWGHV